MSTQEPLIDPLLPPTKVAEMIGIHPSTVYLWRKRNAKGKPQFHLGSDGTEKSGGFRLSEVQAYIELTRRVASPAQTAVEYLDSTFRLADIKVELTKLERSCSILTAEHNLIPGVLRDDLREAIGTQWIDVFVTAGMLSESTHHDFDGTKTPAYAIHNRFQWDSPEHGKRYDFVRGLKRIRSPYMIHREPNLNAA